MTTPAIGQSLEQTARWDYISPNLSRVFPDLHFPNLMVRKEPFSWTYFRREIPHSIYVDKRYTEVGFVNRDEASILYNTALRFRGERALEIGCWMGWSTAHLALGGVTLDVLDPILEHQDIRQSIYDSLETLGVVDHVNLIPDISPAGVESAVSQGGKWSLFFIDGDHNGEGPLKDAVICSRLATEDALILFHDLTSPDVAQGLTYLKEQGWQTMIYQTIQIMGVAWRGNVEPIRHQPDPKVVWEVPGHLKDFAVSCFSLNDGEHGEGNHHAVDNVQQGINLPYKLNSIENIDDAQTSCPPSPLNPKGATERVCTFKVEAVIQQWKDYFNVDVSGEFPEIQSFELYRCLSSKLEFFSPSPLAGSPNLYRQLSEFSWYHSTNKWEYYATVLHFTGRIPSVADFSLLDVGCGQGYFLELALTHGVVQCHGLETSPLAFQAAFDKGLNVENLSLTDYIRAFPQKLGTYDCVCAFQVLEHMEAPLQSLKDLLSLLKPNGTLILTTPNQDSFIRHAEMDPLNMPPHHVTRWRLETFRYLETLLPVRLVSFQFEPLAPYHVDWYLQLTTSSPSQEQARHLKSSEVARAEIPGHTIFCAFQKTGPS